MSGYSIEYVLDLAWDHGNIDTPEAKFMDEFPCINGIEIEYFTDEVTRKKSDFERISQTVFQLLRKVIPEPLLNCVASAKR